MIKQVLTVASFAFGGAGVVLVGYLSSNPLAFTHPVGDLPTVVPLARSFVDAPVAVDVAVEPALVMPEVTISASLRRASRPAVEETLDACSEFRDVGAVYIDPRGATGIRRVRSLCASVAAR
jgi:hypothetical protein